jgi:hypothetical protein
LPYIIHLSQMKYTVYVIECHLLYGIMLRYNILSKGLTFQVV